MGAGSGGFSGEWSCNCYDFMTGHMQAHIQSEDVDWHGRDIS